MIIEITDINVLDQVAGGLSESRRASIRERFNSRVRGGDADDSARVQRFEQRAAALEGLLSGESSGPSIRISGFSSSSSRTRSVRVESQG